MLMALALSILLLSHPRASAAGPFNSEYFELDNGLQVVVIPNHRAPIVVHMMWYRVGSADDPVGKSGIAHFLEHLMFKGTDKLAPGDFSRIVARNGGQENAFTSWDYTGYFQRVARDRLEIVMELEAGRMRGLDLDEEVVRPERDVILEERRAQTTGLPLFSPSRSARLSFCATLTAHRSSAGGMKSKLSTGRTRLPSIDAITRRTTLFWSSLAIFRRPN